MEVRNALRELREIARNLHRVSSPELNANQEVLRERIAIYERELARCLHKNRKAFGLSFQHFRLIEAVRMLCHSMNEEQRENVPTTRFINGKSGTSGSREILGEVKRLAHFQVYAEWLSDLVERFACREEGDARYNAAPIEWIQDVKAGRISIDPTSPIREVETRLTGASLVVESADKRQEKEAPRKPGKAGVRNLKWYLEWRQANDIKKQTKLGFVAEHPTAKIDWIDDGLKLFKSGWRLRDGKPYHIDSEID